MITNWSHRFLNRQITALLLVVFLMTVVRFAKAQTVYLDDNGYFISDSYSQNGVDIGSSTRLEGKIPLLLVHGINAEADQGYYPTGGIGATYSPIYYKWANFLAFFNSRPELVAKYKIYGYGYRSNEKPISELAEDLGSLMRKLEIKNPELAGKRMVVLAHSMGGLITRSFMLKPQNGVSGDKWGERVASLITLGTPHHGSPLNNDSKKIFGALGDKLPLSGALASWELNALFQLTGGADWNELNRSDMWWDNYDNLFAYNFFTIEENNWWLKSLNVSTQYDSKVIAYAGTIGFYPEASPSFAREHVYTPGDGIFAELGFTDSDGAVPSASALFDGHNVSARRTLVTGYDHSQMYLGKTSPGTDPHFVRIGQDLDAIAVAITPPSSFTVNARGECNGTSSRVLLTRSDSSGATGYQVFRNGQSLGAFATGSKEFRDSSVSAGTSYSYSVEASNASGQKMTSNTITLTAPDCSAPDTTAPGLPINLTAFPNPWSRNNLFYIAWNNPNDPSGIARVWWKRGSTPSSPTDGSSLPLPQNNPMSITLNQSEGTQTIYVWLEDGAGNKNHLNNVPVTLRLDTTRPSIAITSHPAAAPYPSAQSTITLSGTFADTLSGVASVKWLNEIGGSGTATMNGSANNGTWLTPTITLYSGANKITITATDAAGNTASTTLTANYLDTSNSSSTTVTITPQGAIDQGARWRVNGGTWRNSGYTELNVPAGPRFVEFINIPGGYRTPAGFSVNVVAGQNVAASGNYTPIFVADPPNTPSNPSPVNGAVSVGRTQPLFSWSGGGLSGQVEYAFFLSADSDPETNPIQVVGFGGVSGTVVPYTGTLLSAKTYSWRIKTRANGITINGPIWRFTTEYAVADLAVKNLALDGNVEPMANVTLSVTVTNQGNFVAPLGYLYFYLSRQPGGKEVRLNLPISLTVYPLQPGQSTNITFAAKLDGLPAGQSFIDAWVDTTAYGATSESDFANNLQTIQLNYIDGKSPQVTNVGLSNPYVKTGIANSISYVATDDVSVKTLDFYYSTDDGLTWVPIQEGYVPTTPTASGAYFNWTMPTNLTVGANLKVRVVARDASGNWGEAIAGPYLIHSGAIPTVTVTSPNGGETWDANTQHSIRWNISSTSPLAGVDVWFIHDDVQEILGGPQPLTATTFNWTPSQLKVTTHGKILIRAMDVNGNQGEHYSDGVFTIRDTSVPPSPPWTTPQALTSNPTGEDSSMPRIATDASGNVHSVYLAKTKTGSNPKVLTQSIHYRKRVAGTWSAAQTVFTVIQQIDAANQNLFDISDLHFAVTRSGIPHVVWNTSNNGGLTAKNNQDLFYSFFDGTAWSVAANLTTNLLGFTGVSTVTSSPSVLVDSSDAVHLLWTDGWYYNADGSRTGEPRIYYAKKDPIGGWSIPTKINDTYSSDPALTISPNGTLVVAFVGSYSNSSALLFLTNSGSGWSSSQLASLGADNFVRLQSDSSNRVHAVWQTWNPSSSSTDVNYSLFNGTLWSVKEVVFSAPSIEFPSLAVDSNNRPQITFEDRDFPASLFYTFKGGTSVWVSPVKLNLGSQIVATHSSDLVMHSVSNQLHAAWTSEIGSTLQVLYNTAYVGSTNDIFAPSILVNAPTSGQILSIGSTSTIMWNASDNVDVTAVDLHFTTNNFSTLTLISLNRANTGSFSWTVPNLGTNVAQVRVTARDAAGNVGLGFSGAFTTTDLTPPTIAVTGPADGATLTGNSTNNVTWTATDNASVAGIDLAYSLNNGANWSDIATNLNNAGSYAWFTPNSATSVLLIRATARDTAGLSASATTQPITIVRANTPPLVPSNPFPPDGSTFVLTVAPTLRWVSGDLDGDPLIYQIRFGTNNNPPVVRTSTDNTFIPGLIRPQLTYYWQVIASDGKAATTGPMWTFTSEPGVTPLTTTSGNQRLPDGQFAFQFNGIFGQPYSIDATTNFVDWITLTNFYNTNEVVQFFDQAATNLQHRFYRVKER